MSSILKALKKVESDKRVCRPDQLGIDARILHERSSASYSRTTATLVATALFVCGSGAMYLYMKHDAAHLIPSQTVSTRLKPVQPQQTVSIPPTIIKDRTVQTAVSAKPSPGAEARSHKDPITAPRPTRFEQQVDMVPVTVAPRPVSAPPAPPASAVSRPSLTVNGIAFQDGGNDNLAVINGITVTNGALIEGVKVEDIQKDRVRFSQGAEKFEIILNKSNR